jgi:hypothetical protein
MTPENWLRRLPGIALRVVGRQSSLGLHGRHVHFSLYFGKNRGCHGKASDHSPEMVAFISVSPAF